MISFKCKSWMKDKLAQIKQVKSHFQEGNLIGRLKDRLSLTKFHFLFHTYKMHVLKGFTAVGLLASISIGGNEYVKMNTNEVYHVMIADEQIGIVSNMDIIELYIEDRKEALKHEFPDVHMVLEVDGIQYEHEKAFMVTADDEAALQKLEEFINPYAIGTELIIDGESVGIVKDEKTAEYILDRIKQKYIPGKKASDEVSILSYEPELLEPGEPVLESVAFLQKIDMNVLNIEPNELIDPEQLIQKLETGDVQPTQYTVQQGDCISCIASKLSISQQVIYDNNIWIKDDKLQIGDVLDLTVLQPTLTVITTERLVQEEEIKFTTDYIEDDTLRLGTIVPISPGKNGLRKIIYELEKANGQLQSQTAVDEVVLVEPIAAVAKKGTKIVLGEGTGKFAWPVVSASITSGYGTRWGKLHKGIDIVSKNRDILASDNGKVVTAGYKSDYGNHIIIDHNNGYRTLYGHLSKIYTSVGKIVEKGEKIGYMGSTGDSTGTHLHFEIQKGTSPENPMKYLSR